MTTTSAETESSQVEALAPHPVPQLRTSRAERQGAVGLVAAGAMTALLSGDVRLAIRATRLLIDDDRMQSDSQAPTTRTTRFRRTWSLR
jgi:hypothetical protein